MSEFLEKISKLSPQRLALLADELNRRLEAAERQRRIPVAIAGIGCRLPGGVHGPEDFWKLLREGRDAIEEVPRSRWNVTEFYDARPDTPGKTITRWGGFIEDPEMFDSKFFGIAPAEAESMDPQQRLLLETAWESLENAGIAPDLLAGSRTGVFAGICNSDYGKVLTAMPPERISPYLALGLSHAAATGRISYLLGLKGPSLAVDTACSSSLVAVHLACQSLRLGECDLALAGGVNLILAPDFTIALSQSRMLSPDGRCKSFSESANGFVRSDGCGMVVLKRLPDAIEHGDKILAVIRGSACNQDGRSSGLTAPNGPSQEEVIRTALANSGMAPDEVDYVEAHGTGTSLGDPIEAGALNEVFASRAGKSDPLYVGSVKTNLGHLESAAGIAGLMKLVLSIHHGEIPASLHLGQPSRHIEWDRLPLQVPTEPTSWKRRGARRVGGISSFGFSGTNAHVLVEEYRRAESSIGTNTGADREESNGGRNHAGPPRAHSSDTGSPYRFPLSAKSASALKTMAARLARHLTDHPELPLAGVARTLGQGRSQFAFRAAVVAASRGELIEGLGGIASRDPGLVAEAAQPAELNPDNRRGLLEAAAKRYRLDGSLDLPEIDGERAETVPLPTYPFERERYWLEDSVRVKREVGESPEVPDVQEQMTKATDDWVYDLVWEPKPLTHRAEEQNAVRFEAGIPERMASPQASDEVLHYARMSREMNPVCTAYIVQALRQLGANSFAPREFTLDEFCQELSVAPSRRRLLARLFSDLSEDALVDRVGDSFRLNPSVFDFIGEHVPGDLLAKLRVAYPQCQTEMNLLDRCGENLAAVLLGHADPVHLLFPDNSMEETEHIYRHSPIARFYNQTVADMVKTAADEVPARRLRILEIGAGTAATTASILPVLDSANVEYVFTDISRAFLSRASSKFSGFDFVDYRTLDIETDPAQQGFDAGVYDIVIAANVLHATADLRRTIRHAKQLLAPGGLLLLLEAVYADRAVDLTFGLTDGWWRFSDADIRSHGPLVSAETWARLLRESGMASVRTMSYLPDGDLPQQIVIAAQADRAAEALATVRESRSKPREWVILADRGGVGAALARRVTIQGHSASLIRRPELGSDIDATLSRLRDRSSENGYTDAAGREIVYLWGLDSDEPAKESAPPVAGVELCGTMLVRAVQVSLGEKGRDGFWIVTRGAQATNSYAPDIGSAVQSLAWGVGRTLRLEAPEQFRALIDLDPALDLEGAADELCRELLGSEFAAEVRSFTRADREDQIAFRGGERLAPRLRHGQLSGRSENPPGIQGLRPDGSYLLAGGLGGIGLRVARWAAMQNAGHLVLLGRTGAGESAGAFREERLRAIEEIRALGSEVTVVEGDVASAEDMKVLFARFGEDFPPLRGIVHAATAVHAAPIADLTGEAIEAMLRAKVAGLWRLHEFTKNRDLDFFLIFSTTASLFGARGMAHYAAANQFADALAHFRRTAGVPALSVNWGVWDVMRLVASQRQEAMQETGMPPMPSGRALAFLRDLMVSDRAQAAIADIDWGIMKPLFQRNRAGGFLEHVGCEGSKSKSLARSIPGHASLRAAVGMTSKERRVYLESFVAEQAAQVLGFRHGEMPPLDAPLTVLGLDSLMAVDLRNRLQTGLGQELPSTIVFDYPAVSDMVEMLETILWAADAGGDGSRAKALGEEIHI